MLALPRLRLSDRREALLGGGRYLVDRALGLVSRCSHDRHDRWWFALLLDREVLYGRGGQADSAYGCVHSMLRRRKRRGRLRRRLCEIVVGRLEQIVLWLLDELRFVELFLGHELLDVWFFVEHQRAGRVCVFGQRVRRHRRIGVILRVT